MWSDADVVNTTLASAGLLVAIVGLGAVYWQIRKVRGAAEAARDASSDALQAMAQRVTAADLSSVRTALRALQNELRASQTESALLSCQSIQEQLAALRKRQEIHGPTARREGVTRALGTLGRLRDALELRRIDSEADFDTVDWNNRISATVQLVVEWQESALFLSAEASGDE